MTKLTPYAKKVALFSTLLIVITALIIAIGAPFMGKEQSGNTTPAYNVGWTRLGEVEGSDGTGTVFWTVNPANGDRVYAIVGFYKGGVYVIPGGKKEEKAHDDAK